MRIRIYSDLHNEFAPFEPPSTDADIVVLAGDIDTQARGVSWANETFNQPVLYCAGNHEFYKGHIDHTLRKMREAAAPHVHVLENQVWICNQTRFLVTTAWTDFSSTGDPVEAMVTCGMWMNDFQVIRAEERFRRLRPADVIERNHDAFDFLVGELAKPFEGKTVVITHHCPVPEVAGDKHEGHLSAAYTNQWHSLISMVDVWIFGHTHRAVDVELNGCRLITNPRGYPKERTGFISDFTIEI
ncbi:MULTISPECIES: metallophosphoesterase [Pseudomonas]|jgi:predicted phosphodiesterase|uniref:Calcineurin-like phosphoesterase n=1 Tax=Pseudomonas migulae TaxID=78543 RepID=A0A1H5H838_9PSED|nr:MULTISPECIES: metallophosphoesterase family protein [Pseudomonas]PMX02305.1 serine/threonine protein phosphatase [Pseudomonas sp. FW215-R2]PMX10991.1 serine/threonine protein phosphatase [Pseudomonas sp. FW215-L1]PMX20823.1 serine/threonine protein phosphatase [Pseudomonas sp. FW215-E1]PNA25490.1 serine/threonine protein phosphatase [Pseudomonas sp. FW215-R4]SEE24153.1 Calcineurin-like phosphoesterase [Pseudomonas migulae]